MYNQAEAIFSQYELDIQEIKKGRGSYICSTEQGMKVITPFRGSNEKGLLLKSFLEQLQSVIDDACGRQVTLGGTEISKFTEVDLKNRLQIEQIMLNKNGEAVTMDEMTGERFLLKDYITGRELDTRNKEELKEAVKLLADYKQKAQKISSEILQKYKYHLVQTDIIQDVTKDRSTIGLWKEATCLQEDYCEQPKKSDSAQLKMVENSTQVVDIRRRHQKELVKVKNFIRGRKKRTEFEQLFLASYEAMQSTMKRSIEILEKHSNAKCMWCHGDVNQHNILYEHGIWQLVNFENFTYSWKVLDMANFFRKIMEKNDWDITLGMELIGLYQKETDLEKEEMEQLYGLLLFPEKFWKLSNHYMNTRKNRVSEKDVEKLKKVVGQEEKRLDFIETLVTTYL